MCLPTVAHKRGKKALDCLNVKYEKHDIKNEFEFTPEMMLLEELQKSNILLCYEMTDGSY